MTFDDIFTAAEQDHNLRPGILRSMAVQESRLNPWAMRFEPAFFSRYIEGRDKVQLRGVWPSGVSENTERFARATSWGLLQIMGQTARELGFVGQFLTQLTDPETGVYWGAKVFASKLDRYAGDYSKGLSAYNAGTATAANVDAYVLPILGRLTQ